MRDIKEKPQKPKIKGNAFKERRPMAKGNAAGRMGRLMKDHYLRERDKGRQEKKPNAVTAAEEQVEQAAEEAVSSARSAAAKGFVKMRQAVQVKRQAAKQAAQDGPGAGHGDSPYHEAAQPTTAPEYGQPQPASEQRQPPIPGERMKQAFLKEKQAQAMQTVRGDTAQMRGPSSISNSTADNLPAVRGRPQTAIKERPRSNAPAIKTRQAAAKRGPSVGTAAGNAAPAAPVPKAARTPKPAKAAARAAAKQAVGQRAQAGAKQLAVSRAKKAAQTAASLGRRAAQATAHAAATLIGAIVGAAGGTVLLILLCFILIVAAVVASPFGIFFADQQKEPGTISPNAAVAQVNVEYAARLAELQEGDYDSIQIHGSPPDWREVIAVFACKTAGADDGVDVTAFDEDRVKRLRQVFWDMTPIRAEVEVIEHEDSTETILHIYIEAKTIAEMQEEYRFTSYQNEALDALLEEMELLGGLLGDLSITQEDALALLENLPDDLSPEREAAIRHALTLVGKVNYFWGGKSLVLGWDSRWGTTQKVTAAGSSSTGTYRPYGMDCSGFVDWVFYNASGGEYIIGHGGGAASQHTYCTPISWSEAIPGDLVFYPGDSHVGIVGGRDANGNLLIIHCASGANNVVITGLQGFTSIGRPVYFGG